MQWGNIGQRFDFTRNRVIDQNRRRLVMFGGWSGESTLYADLWTAPIKSDC